MVKLKVSDEKSIIRNGGVTMFGPMNLFWDSTYILIIIGMGLSFLASNYVKTTFKKYDEYANKKGYTGTDVANIILAESGIRDVRVQEIGGDLTDNYNSGNKTLNLSQATAHSQSVAAIGVAAHECGHAVQDQVNYFPLKLRSLLVPAANIGATISFPLIMAGVFFGQFLINIGIVCFSLALIFQLVTLPVEFNASSRALNILKEKNVLDSEELGMARKVLIAAALTYVASAISVFLQLLRLIIIFGNRRD